MSHVVESEMHPTCLDTLAAGAAVFGGKLTKKSTYNWFGQHVGDYPLPKGYTKEDMGKCEYALSFPGIHYEVGVGKSKSVPGAYDLLFDFWGDGRKLKKLLGEGLAKLKTEYTKAAYIQVAKAKGMKVAWTKSKNGNPLMVLSKGGGL